MRENGERENGEKERENVDVIPINRMDGVGLADRTVSGGGGGWEGQGEEGELVSERVVRVDMGRGGELDG